MIAGRAAVAATSCRRSLRGSLMPFALQNLQLVLKPAHPRRAAHDCVGMWPDEYRPNGPWRSPSRLAVIPVQKHSDACACQAEPDQFDGLSRHGVHCDLQKLTERLV